MDSFETILLKVRYWEEIRAMYAGLASLRLVFRISDDCSCTASTALASSLETAILDIERLALWIPAQPTLHLENVLAISRGNRNLKKA